ncbi:MAG: type II toxin-antitoxin system VapC family toxin [Candidatus Aenigmarchaeota archaeon]|nr:type II toxin-antitoxin system VapC family toxin [Candidatus Aenigmarchaeota archaeon]
MIILDSDFIIDLFNGIEAAREKIAAIPESNEELATTIFNAQEVLYGYASTGTAGQNYQHAAEFFMEIMVIGYQWEAMEKTMAIKKQLKGKGSPIGIFDEMIGGICLAHGASILTRNVEHFAKIEGLKIVKY